MRQSGASATVKDSQLVAATETEACAITPRKSKLPGPQKTKTGQ
jgi:hypothetical protein